jgi:hypothetical protein
MSPPELEALLAKDAEKHSDFQILERAYHDKCAELKRLREDLLAALAQPPRHCDALKEVP